MVYKSLEDIIKPQEEEPMMSKMAPTDYENMQSPVAPDMMYSAPKLADVLPPKPEQPEAPMLAEADAQQSSLEAPQAPDTRTDYEKLEAKLQELRGLDAARQETASKYDFGAKAAAIIGDAISKYQSGAIQKNVGVPIQHTGPSLQQLMGIIGEVKAPSTAEQKQALMDQYKQLALNQRAKDRLTSEDARAKRSEDLRRELTKAQIEGSLKEAGIKASGKGELTPYQEMRKEESQLQKQEKDLKSLKEIETRKRTIEDNVERAKSIIDKYGTFEMTGPQSEELNSIIDEISVDMAKLQDPDSVARPNEVALVRKNLVPEGIAGKLGMSNETAISLLDKFKARVDERAKNAYQVRGIKAPTGEEAVKPNATKQEQPAKKAAAGDTVTIKGKKYKVAEDGDTLVPVGQ